MSEAYKIETLNKAHMMLSILAHFVAVKTKAFFSLS